VRELVCRERDIYFICDCRGLEDLDVKVHAVMSFMVEIGLLKVMVVRFRVLVLTGYFGV
jgi:hypothetical protein